MAVTRITLTSPEKSGVCGDINREDILEVVKQIMGGGMWDVE